MMKGFVRSCLLGLSGVLMVSCGSPATKGAEVSEVLHREVKQPSGITGRLITMVNQERSARGLVPLQENAEMAALARDHSEFLMRKNQKRGSISIGHDGFSERGEVIMHQLGMLGAGENVAANWGHKDQIAERIVQSWMDSKGHKKNIVSKKWRYSGMGVSVAPNGAVYATQMFGGEKRAM